MSHAAADSRRAECGSRPPERLAVGRERGSLTLNNQLDMTTLKLAFITL
jgi:hypothetical protein